MKLGFIIILGVLIFGGFGHEAYTTTKAAHSGDLTPVMRPLIEGWFKSPPMMGLIGAAVGYLIGHSHGGGK